MEFFVSPIKIFFKFQKLQSLYLLEKLHTLIIISPIFHRLNKFSPDFTFDSKILSVIKICELFCIKSVYSHVHHGLLSFVHSESLTLKLILLILILQVLMNELEHHGQFLFSSFLSSQTIFVIRIFAFLLILFPVILFKTFSLLVDQLVFICKVIMEINSFCVIKFWTLFKDFFWLVFDLAESKQCICVYHSSLLGATFMHDVNVRLQFIFCFEANVTFRFAIFVRTQKVRFTEVNLKTCVVFVVHIFIAVTAQMTS